MQWWCLSCCHHVHNHCESSASSFDECRLSAHHQTKSTNLGLSPPINGCCCPHAPLPFVIITQSESWYSFYCSMEGGRLSQPRYCSKGTQPVPKAVYRRGCHDKHDCLWPLTLQRGMLPTDRWDLQMQVGVNNVVTRQRSSCESNSQPSSCESSALTTRLPSHCMLSADIDDAL